jgi:hypothetical protein
MARVSNTNWEKRNTWVTGGKPEGKRPLGRSRCRQVDNTKMDLEGMVMGRVIGWIGLTQDRDNWRVLVNVVMIFLVP